MGHTLRELGQPTPDPDPDPNLVSQDVGHTLRELGQQFTEKSLSGACGRRQTCTNSRELPVLTKDAAFTLCPRPHALRRAAFESLRESPLLTATDGVVCSHPAALCEVWLVRRQRHRSWSSSHDLT